MSIRLDDKKSSVGIGKNDDILGFTVFKLIESINQKLVRKLVIKK